MTNNKTKLSIIIPVYNGEKTIGHALDSILLQDTDFNFEIIVIDDKSTDGSEQIVQNYKKKFENIRLLQNERNMGKGFSVMKAYEAALGEYFHILDADDYFISYNKLQKQVDFLDENPDHIAVAHNSLLLFSDNQISFVSKHLQQRSYSYEEAISGEFYFHTSSYMYRKIEKKLPEIFLIEPMRGDAGLFFYHVFKSKKKVMYFPDISSVYHIHGHGIWSGITNEKKYSLTITLFRTYLDKIIVDKSTMEYKIWEAKLNTLIETGKFIPAEHDKKSINEVLQYCENSLIKIDSPAIREKAFQGMYSLKIVDQLCEACGRVILYKKSRRLTNRNFNNDKAAILVSGFSPNGEGVFNEIKELIEIFLNEGKSVEIYSSNRAEADKSIITNHFNNPKIKYIETNRNESYSEQIEQLIDNLYESCPGRIYPFISHDDPVLNSVIQRGLGKTITLDCVFDHGLLLGIHNSSIDKFMIKTESQAEAFSQVAHPEKFVFIPPVVNETDNGRERAKMMIIEEMGHKINLQKHPRIKIHDLTETGFFQLDKGLFEKAEEFDKIEKMKMSPLIKIKSILGRIIPTPANSFHRRMNELTSQIQTTDERLDKIENLLSEVLWAQIYNSTIENSDWLINKSVSPGRWAVGYPFLYILYRVLNDVKPKSILELGLGQSTKIISQYVESEKDCNHYVLEHDEEWISFFANSNSLSDRTCISKHELQNSPYENGNENIRQYSGFYEKFSSHKFDLIVIDGPIGTTTGDYSRVDVLKILPDSLDNSFVIMIDDTQRRGESNTFKEIQKILTNSEINYLVQEYKSQKSFCIMVSADLKFINSM